MTKPRILVVAHGHPDFNSGGGEIAAYNLHKQINRSREFSSVFLARHNNKAMSHAGTPFSGNGRDAEILFHSNMPDKFYFSQPDKEKIWRDFPDVLKAVKPDIVHFHHYIHLGLELISKIRHFNPMIRIVLTLHEYLAICNNRGLMIKRKSGELCSRETPFECTRCFPEYNPQAFMLRKRFIQAHFELVDTFIAPSRFLANRYAQWGLPVGRIKVIENVPRPETNTSIVKPLSDDTRLRFSYFGQVSELKGVDLLLEAVYHLPETISRQVTLDIYGNALEKQPRSFQRSIRRLLKKNTGLVNWHGAYQQRHIGQLMQATDWIIVPSRWWENSPMVILEAQQQGTPVICSDIGGLCEKVDPSVAGLHFATGNVTSLCQQIGKAVKERQNLPALKYSLLVEAARTKALELHYQEYRNLMSVTKFKSYQTRAG